MKLHITFLAALLTAAPLAAQTATVQNWLVDQTMSDKEAATSPLLFNDLKAALRAADGQRDVHITIAPGVYWLDDPDDADVRRTADGTSIPYAVEVNCPGLQLTGEDPDPERTVIAVNRGQTQGAMGNYTMLHLRGDDLRFENLTLGNYCNVDLVYPGRPDLSRPKRAEAIVQAQLAICEGSDRVLARNCRFISRLNLCPLVGGRRTVFDGCYFESTDDALAGSAVYHRCRFTLFSSKPFYNTSLTGAVFLGCHIDTHTRGTQYLTKVPGAVALIDTDFRTLYDASASPLRIDWTRDPYTPVCYQTGVRLNGRPYCVGSEAKTTGVRLSDTDPLLSAYRLISEMGDTLYNVLNLVGTPDGWDPLEQRGAIAEMESQLGTTLTGLPVTLRVEASSRHLAATDDTLSLRAQLLCWGGYPTGPTFTQASTLRWSAPAQVAVRPGEYPTAQVVSRNRFDRNLETLVTAVSDYGPQGMAAFRVAAYLTDAPTLSEAPTIVINKKEKCYQATYQFAQNKAAEDVSTITWYRCPDEATAADLVANPERRPAEATAVRRAKGTEGATYSPTRADLNEWLVATVTPQQRGTRAGHPTAALIGPVKQGKLLHWALFDERRMSTDFHDLPVEKQTHVRPGSWTFDVYKPADTEAYAWEADTLVQPWYYGAAQDAAVGQGLVQQTRGARLFYTPTREACRSMHVTAIFDPCKSGGQGFGSATGQYLDLYVAFDPATLTGYGVRIERTPKYDKAVTFTLMHYDHGASEALTEPQASSCYRTSCTVKLSLEGNRLTASASTSAAEVPAREDVSPTVQLEAKVEAPKACALGLQHTGTVGAGATLIHYLEGTWE